MPKKVLISCGELSADEHAAHLVTSLKKILPDCQFKAMGGRNLRAAGVETIIDSESKASVMGFTEVLKNISSILKTLKKMKSCLKEWRPDLLILIDFPDFNMRLAKYASKLGIKVLYFISPQVWAWRTGRIEFFKKYIDKIAVIFPFEKDFLAKYGYNRAEFVGHPMIDHLSEKRKSKEEIRNKLGLSEKPLLAVFPGSRKQEIEKHLNILSSGIEKLTLKYPDVQVVINVAPSLEESYIKEKLPSIKNLKVIKENSLDVMSASDAGILKSGTSNLQAAVMGLPFSMLYIASPFSAFVVKNLVKIKQYSIVNIIKENTVKEILQQNATPDEIFKEAESILFDQTRRAKMLSDFSVIRNSLHFNNDSNQTSFDRVAKIAKSLMS